MMNAATVVFVVNWRGSTTSGSSIPTSKWSMLIFPAIAGGQGRGSRRRTRRARRCAGSARRNGTRPAHGHQMHELGSIDGLYSTFLKSRFEKICQIESAGRTLKETVSFLPHQTLAKWTRFDAGNSLMVIAT